MVATATEASTRTTLSAEITDALATLSDRQLRRLLGARTFGLEHFRRGVVHAIAIDGPKASGEIRANDKEPFDLEFELPKDSVVMHMPHLCQDGPALQTRGRPADCRS